MRRVFFTAAAFEAFNTDFQRRLGRARRPRDTRPAAMSRVISALPCERPMKKRDC